MRGSTSWRGRTSATLFMVMHAALAVLLARLSRRQDIAIGTPVAGRGEAALDDLVGHVRQHAGVATAVDRARVVRGAAGAGPARPISTPSRTPTSRSSGWWRCSTRPVAPRRHPLFQVGLSFQNLELPTLELPELGDIGLDLGIWACRSSICTYRFRPL